MYAKTQIYAAWGYLKKKNVVTAQQCLNLEKISVGYENRLKSRTQYISNFCASLFFKGFKTIRNFLYSTLSARFGKIKVGGLCLLLKK